MNKREKKNPNSLFFLCAKKLWVHSDVNVFKEFVSEFHCWFCYKTLLHLNREHKSLCESNNSKYFNLNYEITTNTCSMYNDGKMYRVLQLDTKNLNVMKKFILLHILYQKNLKKKIIFNQHYYNIRFKSYIEKYDTIDKEWIKSIVNFHSSLFSCWNLFCILDFCDNNVTTHDIGVEILAYRSIHKVLENKRPLIKSMSIDSERDPCMQFCTCCCSAPVYLIMAACIFVIMLILFTTNHR